MSQRRTGNWLVNVYLHLPKVIRNYTDGAFGGVRVLRTPYKNRVVEGKTMTFKVLRDLKRRMGLFI